MKKTKTEERIDNELWAFLEELRNNEIGDSFFMLKNYIKQEIEKSKECE